MKKILLMLMLVIPMVIGCKSETKNTLKKYGISDVKTCDNLDAIIASGDQVVKDKGAVYCAIDTKNNLKSATAFINAGYDAKRISEFLKLPYFDESKVERYIDFDDKKKSVEDIVTYVNIGLDKPVYGDVDVIENTDDILMLVNKYHRLSDNYVPNNLVKTPNACVIGKDYSCQTETQYLHKEAADAFEKLVEAGKKEGINIKAIASYRSVEYQQNLYNYYYHENGQEYADKYYARPGQSEHNTALAIDITINDEPFNEIENSQYYDWVLENMPKYGFILRYPKDKVTITGYQYESWHFRYVGIDAAKKITQSGLTLDEYIARREK